MDGRSTVLGLFGTIDNITEVTAPSTGTMHCHQEVWRCRNENTLKESKLGHGFMPDIRSEKKLCNRERLIAPGVNLDKPSIQTYTDQRRDTYRNLGEK
ncbi:hypothetical protein BDZ89DRAFT_1063138, partial [Hymenopellis radicata]